jgi:cytochrome P450
MEYNPFSYELQDDPWSVYTSLREASPLYRNEALDLWALSRFEDVWNGLADWQTFSSAHGTTTPGLEPLYPWMLHMDPPEATRLRNLVSKAFTPQRVAQLEPSIRELTTHYLAPLLERDACDIVGEFSAARCSAFRPPTATGCDTGQIIRSRWRTVRRSAPRWRARWRPA